MAAQFVQRKVDAVGVQEARTSGPSLMEMDPFWRITSGHEGGRFGCELWLRKRLVCGASDAEPERSVVVDRHAIT
eukprot:4669224-Alexandrium_andersonii.AAC.1